MITRCKDHYDATQHDDIEQFNNDIMEYVFEAYKLGLLMGTSIKEIKDLGL